VETQWFQTEEDAEVAEGDGSDEGE
jgi:hypothetical protein